MGRSDVLSGFLIGSIAALLTVIDPFIYIFPEFIGVNIYLNCKRLAMCRRCSSRRGATSRNVYLKFTPTWDWSAAAVPTRRPTPTDGGEMTH